MHFGNSEGRGVKIWKPSMVWNGYFLESPTVCLICSCKFVTSSTCIGHLFYLKSTASLKVTKVLHPVRCFPCILESDDHNHAS